jgi:predicted GTPase
MPKHVLWPWLLITLLGCLPFLALMVLGGWWLWQQHLLLLWLSITASCTGIVWIVARLLRRRQKTRAVLAQPVLPIPGSQLDEAVWKQVVALAEQFKQDKTLDLAESGNWFVVGRQVLAVVARHYHPEAKKPELKIPLTELLRLVEQVSHDLHTQLAASVPLSHVITLADGLNLQRWMERLRDASSALRLGRMLLNPFGGVLAEAGSYAQGKVVDLTLPHLQALLLDMYVQKVGEYAILLYSGRLVAPSAPAEILSKQSRQDVSQAQARQEHQAGEPLRIMVAGQTNAGKSTLINTLFESPVAAADVLSCTADIRPYQLRRQGILSGLIFDTPGYGQHSHWLEDYQQALDQTDMLLLVCAANNAARQADRHFLKAFRQHFLDRAERRLPTLIIVVTHIDRLSPSREWLPPYDLISPATAKGRNILAALQAIEDDLDVPVDTAIVPVSLGDNDGMGVYNVDSLIQVMGQHMDEAELARLLRCLKESQGRDTWPQLWRQVGNSGRWLLRKAGGVLP